MTLTINLPPDLEKSVRQQAAKNGQDVSDFVLQAVNDKLAKTKPVEAPTQPVPAPVVREEFYAELGRLPETVQAFEAQRAIFRQWRSDPRFEVYWPTLDHALESTLEDARKWAARLMELPALDDDDLEVYKKMREYEIQHAGDHVL